MQAAAHGHRSLLDFAMHRRETLHLQQQRLARGSMVFVLHDETHCVYVIRSGTLRVSVPAEGGLHVFLRGGAVFTFAKLLRERDAHALRCSRFATRTKLTLLAPRSAASRSQRRVHPERRSECA